MDGNLDAWLWNGICAFDRLALTATRVAYFTNGEVRCALLEVWVVSGYRQGPRVSVDFGVGKDVCLLAPAVFDLEFNVERWNTSEDNRNTLFTSTLNFAEAVSPAWIRKAGSWTGIDSLVNNDRRGSFLIMDIILVAQFDKVVLTVPSIAGVERNRCHTNHCVKTFGPGILLASLWVRLHIVLNLERRSSWLND